MRGSIPVNASTAPNKLQSTNGEYMYYMYHYYTLLMKAATNIP